MKQNENFPVIVFFRIHIAVLCANFQLLTLNFDFGDFRRTFDFFYPIGFPYNPSMARILTVGCSTVSYPELII